MNDDVRDILLVFIANALSYIAQEQSSTIPIGLQDFIRTATLESNGNLPFPADISDLLYVYILNNRL